MMIKVFVLAFCLLLSPAAVSASTLDVEPAEGMTTEVATSQPEEMTTEETPVYLERDENLLKHTFIDEIYTVVINRDIYVMLVRIYNLLLMMFYTFIGMFVVHRVFEAFKPAYKVSKE